MKSEDVEKNADVSVIKKSNKIADRGIQETSRKTRNKKDKSKVTLMKLSGKARVFTKGN